MINDSTAVENVELKKVIDMVPYLLLFLMMTYLYLYLTRKKLFIISHQRKLILKQK